MYTYSDYSQFPMASAPPEPLYPLLPTARPPLTQTMHGSTVALLRKAGEVSDSILNPQATEVAVTPTRPHTYTSFPPAHFDFSNHSRTYNVLSTHNENHTNIYPDERREERENDRGTRILAGLASLVVLGVSAYFFGRSTAENEEIQEEQMELSTLKHRWQAQESVYLAQNPQYCDLVNDVTRHVESILERKQTNKTHKIALCILSLGAGASGLAGALLGSGLLMGSAVALGAGVGMFALYKIGYSFFSKRDKNDATAIQNDLVAIQHHQLDILPG